jgi:hypothetical protein
MIEELKNENYIKKVTVEYVDGTTDEIQNEFVVVVTEKPENGNWNIKLSEEASVAKMLDFAYDAVDEIENASMDEELPKKVSHLKVLKGGLSG